MLQMQNSLITVIGGSGFLGKYLVQELVKHGYRVQVISRQATRAIHLIPLGANSPVTLRDGDLTRPKTLHGALQGSYAVINLAGIIFEKQRQRFTSIHAQCPERLAQMAKEEGVKKFVHISALGIESSSRSRYARSKLAGEKAVQSIFSDAIIIRPGLMFGAEDMFLSRIAKMAKISPIIPLIGRADAKLQPVYVNDVAAAIAKTIASTASSGKIYELGGASIYELRNLLGYVAQMVNNKAIVVPLPTAVARAGAIFAKLLPTPPITNEQITMLQYDNLVNPEFDGFAALRIAPSPLEVVMPEYLLPCNKRSNPHMRTYNLSRGTSGDYIADIIRSGKYKSQDCAGYANQNNDVASSSAA